ncbi:MAG: sensor histidine kinase [Bacteroidetes bacterium]|nr:sensor histidine kinase [Bacteroidota bacterium]
MNLDKYLKYLFNLNNPIYFAIIFTVLIIFVFYIFQKYILFPKVRKHKIQLKEIELKNAKLMALFPELNPNPLIRIDINGIIILTNNAAKETIKIPSLVGLSIKDIIPKIDFSIEDFIRKNKIKNIVHTFNNKYFSITIKGISFLSIAQLYFTDLTKRKLFEEKLYSSQKQLKELIQHEHLLVEGEKNRIANELHDGIGQNLLFIKASLQRYSDKLKSDLGEETFDQLLSSFDETITDLKSIIYNLKPSVLEELGLGAAITTLCQSISDKNDIKCNVDIIGFEERIDSNQEITIYRIIQESLNNILKHSKAKEFTVTLLEENGNIKILISDDGIGFETSNNNYHISGMGLRSIKERAESYSGTFKIESQLKSGTLLIIEMPKKT